MAPVMVGRAAGVIDRIDFLTEGEFLTAGTVLDQEVSERQV